MALPPPGAALPLPSSLSSLDAIPAPVASLDELAGDAELLALVVSTEGAMSDPFRQTLVGLQ